MLLPSVPPETLRQLFLCFTAGCGLGDPLPPRSAQCCPFLSVLTSPAEHGWGGSLFNSPGSGRVQSQTPLGSRRSASTTRASPRVDVDASPRKQVKQTDLALTSYFYHFDDKSRYTRPTRVVKHISKVVPLRPRLPVQRLRYPPRRKNRNDSPPKSAPGTHGVAAGLRIRLLTFAPSSKAARAVHRGLVGAQKKRRVRSPRPLCSQPGTRAMPENALMPSDNPRSEHEGTA